MELRLLYRQRAETKDGFPLIIATLAVFATFALLAVTKKLCTKDCERVSEDQTTAMDTECGSLDGHVDESGSSRISHKQRRGEDIELHV